MKLCIDCKHHRKTPWEGMGATVDIDECDYYKRVSPVDGYVTRPRCKDMRAKPNRCGQKGRYWAKK